MYEAENAKSEQEINFAKLQFLETLLYLRKVILQDSCRMKNLFPNNKLVDHPVFSHKDYKDFQESILRISEQDHVQEQTLEERMPTVVESLNIKIDQLIESDKTKTKQIQGLQTQVKIQYMQIKKTYRECEC